MHIANHYWYTAYMYVNANCMVHTPDRLLKKKKPKGYLHVSFYIFCVYMLVIMAHLKMKVKMYVSKVPHTIETGSYF